MTSHSQGKTIFHWPFQLLPVFCPAHLAILQSRPFSERLKSHGQFYWGHWTADLFILLHQTWGVSLCQRSCSFLVLVASGKRAGRNRYFVFRNRIASSAGNFSRVGLAVRASLVPMCWWIPPFPTSGKRFGLAAKPAMLSLRLLVQTVWHHLVILLNSLVLLGRAKVTTSRKWNLHFRPGFVTSSCMPWDKASRYWTGEFIWVFCNLHFMELWEQGPFAFQRWPRLSEQSSVVWLRATCSSGVNQQRSAHWSCADLHHLLCR